MIVWLYILCKTLEKNGCWDVRVLTRIDKANRGFLISVRFNRGQTKHQVNTLVDEIEIESRQVRASVKIGLAVQRLVYEIEEMTDIVAEDLFKEMIRENSL